MNLPDLIGPVKNKDPKPSCSQKAVLWAPDDVLARAMESFLEAGETWQVIRIPADEDIRSLVEQVQRIRPSLLILYHRKPDDDTDPLMKLLDDQPELKVLADQPELKVITMSLENNHIQVYSKQSITIRGISDLLSIIENCDSSEQSLERR